MLLLFSILSTLNAQFWEEGGKCKALPAIGKLKNNCFSLFRNILADFDKSQYAGVWYEQLRYDYPGQKRDSKCTTAEYGPRDETSVTVKNSEIDPKITEDGLKWALGYIYGKAVQVQVIF